MLSKEDMATMDEFRHAISKISADKDAFNKLVNAYDVEDLDTCRELFKKFDFKPPICYLMCQFICWLPGIVKCYRKCKIVCK